MPELALGFKKAQGQGRALENHPVGDFSEEPAPPQRGARLQGWLKKVLKKILQRVSIKTNVLEYRSSFRS
jgi:hypothetical protein